ncbi:MAG: hypothetical protein ACTSR2_00635 [Candidatus Hodarchaeales archaeon]
MIIWKPLTKYKKHREEHAYHCDFALEEGEVFELKLPNGEGIKEICPKGKTLKFHFEICVEPFEKNG